MGLIYANIELRNPSRPDLQPLAVEALVDTGAVTLCIPQHVAVQLDLHEIEQREVTTADERSHVVPYVGPLQVGFHSRRCFTGALVIGETVLLGAIPMEDMDLVVSPSRQTLTVNPKSPNLPSAVVKRLSASSLSPCEPRAGREPERGDTALNSEYPGNKGQGNSTANHFNSIPLTAIPLTSAPASARSFSLRNPVAGREPERGAARTAYPRSSPLIPSAPISADQRFVSSAAPLRSLRSFPAKPGTNWPQKNTKITKQVVRGPKPALCPPTSAVRPPISAPQPSTFNSQPRMSVVRGPKPALCRQFSAFSFQPSSFDLTCPPQL